MRRKENNGLKKLLYIYGAILLILIITSIVVYITYNNKVKESAKQSLIAAEKLTDIVPNTDILEETSSQISKTIEEAIEESVNQVIEITEEQSENTNEVVEDIPQESVQTTESNNVEEIVEPVKPLEFSYPVEGEIIKEFAIDNLVFSETLQEWIVHKGLDIKAPRTTVVKAAEDGTIKSIKTDPRYGLTVIIEHRDGYKTIYANLLTTEFVTEGEKVIKGQSIGTVGNTAAFESVDEPHLHFEVLKDMVQVDPSIYVK